MTNEERDLLQMKDRMVSILQAQKIWASTDETFAQLVYKFSRLRTTEGEGVIDFVSPNGSGNPFAFDIRVVPPHAECQIESFRITGGFQNSRTIVGNRRSDGSWEVGVLGTNQRTATTASNNATIRYVGIDTNLNCVDYGLGGFQVMGQITNSSGSNPANASWSGVTSYTVRYVGAPTA